MASRIIRGAGVAPGQVRMTCLVPEFDALTGNYVGGVFWGNFAVLTK